MADVAHSQVLYDIDFNGQSLNQVVQTGAPPDHVSQVVFGSPEVVSAFGGLTDTPLRFDTVNTPGPIYYDQIRLTLSSSPFRTLDVSFDLTTLNLIGSANQFSVLLDAPTTRALWFHGDGQIELFSPARDHLSTPIGTFTDGETFRVRLHIDYDLSRWWAYRDDILMGESVFIVEEYVRAIRFSYGAVPNVSTPDDSGVAIDNLIVEVPEPHYLTSLIIAACLIQLAFRRARCQGSPRPVRAPLPSDLLIELGVYCQSPSPRLGKLPQRDV